MFAIERDISSIFNAIEQGKSLELRDRNVHTKGGWQTPVVVLAPRSPYQVYCFLFLRLYSMILVTGTQRAISNCWQVMAPLGSCATSRA